MTRRVSQPRINRFALQGQHAEDALMNSAQWFLADESLQSFDPQGEFPQGQTIALAPRLLAPQPRKIAPGRRSRARK